MVTASKGRVVRNLKSTALTHELDARMQKNIELDAELRHVAPTRRGAPWLRKAIELLCETQERERAGNGKGGE